MKKAFLLMLLLFLILGCSDSQAEKGESFSDIPTIETPTIIKNNSINYPESILKNKEQVDISIGVYHSVSGGLLFLADGLEYFEKNGLNVTMKLYSDYKTLLDGFKKGEVDVATIGLYESIMLALEDIDFIGLAPLIWKQIYSW
jgi:ABC-type nitrate/sulfonate/bicarbonate transport system substrate-binding protein